MKANFLESFLTGIKTFFRGGFSKIHEINKRYAVPRLKMTGWVAVALLFLRLYLLLLVTVLFYKFFTLIK